MRSSAIIVAVLAVFGVVVGKSLIGDGEILSYSQARLYEEEILEFIGKLQEKLKAKDPLNKETVDLKYLDYWIKASDIFAEGFSQFEVTKLKISILLNFEIIIKLPTVSAKAGPFQAGCPKGEIFSSGQNYFDLEGGSVEVKGSFSLISMEVKNLSLNLKINGATLELNDINDDPEYTQELNDKANVFLTETINDSEYQKTLAEKLEAIINQLLSEYL